MIAWYRAGLSLDLTQQLARIRVPVTVIVPFDSVVDPYRGFKSANGKLAAYQRWIAHAPFGTAIMIDRSRHFVMIDRPRAFETALEGALMR